MLPARTALRRPNDHARIRDARARLVPEAFPAVQPGFEIDADQRIFCVGSCFARNIEKHLVRIGLDVPSARFSVPYGEFAGERRNLMRRMEAREST